MKTTARERLLKRRHRTIEVDGDEFYARSMTLREVIWVQERTKEGKAEDFATLAYIVANCLTDEEGNPIFENPQDDGIQDIPTDTLQQITRKIGKLSEEGSGKVALKNSEATP